MISTNHNFYYAWDILGLYRQLFGHVGIPLGKVQPVKTGSGKDNDERYLAETGKAVEAWDSNLLSGSGKRTSDLKGQSFMMPLKLDNWTFPIEPLVSVSGKKETIVTKVTGLKKPVVEEIAMDSYSVSIKGVFINEDNDDYPFRDVRRLSWMLEKRGSIPVVNKLLSLFDINYLVVTEFKCDAVEGQQSMQWYTIEAISDDPVNLLLKEVSQ